MDISINGETRRVPDGTTAAGLIEMLDLRGRRLAVEVNGEIVPKSQHPRFCLSAGDEVEIVQAVGGG